jgi:uncharacterized protein (DUF433 family)
MASGDWSWTMNLPDFLCEWAHGEIMLQGHRIALHHVVPYYNEGDSPEMLLGRFPTLSLPLIHKVIAFYLENRADVDAYVAAQKVEIARLASSPSDGPGTLELRRRLESIRPARTP